jgi:UDP-glucose 4-epimerase
LEYYLAENLIAGDSPMSNILVAGGAGYIGSHVTRALLRRNLNVTVVDDLSTGHRWAVPGKQLLVEDIGNRQAIKEILLSRKIDTVMHFAAHIVVSESVSDPYQYYVNNVAKTLELLKAMEETGANNFIFSSSAAVYGNPETVPIPEDEPVKPINAYGIRSVSLRYFNAAGADEEGNLGEVHEPETHLIPLLLKAARGERERAYIFGTDYPTQDGTCIRDYIHVNDLAEAHILALFHLQDGGGSDIFNCGYGKGHSVREVVEAVKKATGIDFPVSEVERRPGDPPVLVADSRKLKRALGWKAKHDDLEYIVKTAWEWEKRV